jgi:hypothetical protein
MVDVGFLFRVFPGGFSWEELNIKNLTEIAEILFYFRFTAIIRQLVDVNLVVGETSFERYCISADLDITELEETRLMLFARLSISVMLALLTRNDDLAGVELAFGEFLVKSLCDFFLGLGLSGERNLRQEDVRKSGHY